MTSEVDWSKAEKFSNTQKYFNISVLWIFYYRYVIRILYYLRFPPILVLTISFVCGLLSVWFIWENKLIIAAILLHFKDIFDACDGSLARLTSRTSRIGRFLDSLEDMLVLTLVIAVIAVKAYSSSDQSIYILLAVITWFSLFLQCSYFNYYQLKYSQVLDKNNLNSRIDENRSEQDKRYYTNPFKQIFLNILQTLYQLLYSWQDKLIQKIDQIYLKNINETQHYQWYGNKFFLTLNSALCFGTHIFIFIICLLFGNPALSLWIIAIIFNIYFMIILFMRGIHLKRLRKYFC